MATVSDPISPIDEALSQLNRLGTTEEAIAALDAIEKKRKRRNYIRYFEPWTEQADALKKFTDDKKLFALLGGNRSGKTILGSFIAIAWALGKEYFRNEPAWKWVQSLPIPEPPNNIWVVGLDFPTVRDVIWYEKLRHGKDHPPFLPNDNSVRRVSDADYQVFFENGSLLTCKSADSGREKFQGASVDLIWIDEECDESVYDECFQRTLDCSGRILLTLTPLTDINSGVRTPWIYDLYEDWRAGQGDMEFCQLSTINSPFIPELEKERLIAKWKGDPEESARLYGGFVRRSGLVYETWNRTVHVIRPFKLPNHWQRIVSIDPAATGVTAGLWVAVDDNSNLYGFREYYEKDKIVSDHAKGIKIRCGGEPVDIWLLDPTWGEQRNAETHKTGAQLWREAGIPVRLPDVGEDFGLHVTREYINASTEPNPRHPKFYLFEGCPNFEYEITHYTWDTFQAGAMKGQSKEKPRKSHDHMMNAFQYLCAVRPTGKRNRSLRKTEDFMEDGKPSVNLASYT